MTSRLSGARINTHLRERLVSIKIEEYTADAKVGACALIHSSNPFTTQNNAINAVVIIDIKGAASSNAVQ
jgi:hypothetical protein